MKFYTVIHVSINILVVVVGRGLAEVEGVDFQTWVICDWDKGGGGPGTFGCKIKDRHIHTDGTHKVYSP